MHCEPSQGVGLTYFVTIVIFMLCGHYYKYKQELEKIVIVPFFSGWNEKDNGTAERLKQNLDREKLLRKEIYKERKIAKRLNK